MTVRRFGSSNPLKLNLQKKKFDVRYFFFFYSLFNFNKKIRLATLINNRFQGFRNFFLVQKEKEVVKKRKKKR